MATVNISQLSEQLLKCPVCLETFDKPKILPCLHSFCQKCLKKISKDGEALILCPTCRNEINLPPGGVQELPTNFFINNMLDFISIQSFTSKPIDCTNCQDGIHAVARCGDCVEFLCEQCLAAHKRTKLTKDHEVLALKDMQTASVQEKMHRPLYCSQHDREILKYYCKTCDDPVCRECLIMEHREHDYGYLKDVSMKQRQQVRLLVENTNSQIGSLEKAISNVTRLIERVNAKSQGIQQEITKNFSKCVEVLKEKEEELLVFVDNECRIKCKNLGLQKENLETLLSSISSSCQFSENVLEHGNEAEVMLVKKQLTKRLGELQNTHMEFEPLEDDSIEYEFFTDEFRRAIQHAGHIRAFSTVPFFCSATGIGLHKAKADVEAVFQVTTVDRNRKPYEYGGDRISVNVEQEDGVKFEGSVVDNNDGTYFVSYIPKLRGKHTIHVNLREKPIKGSPFNIMVSGRVDYHRLSNTTRSFGAQGGGGGEFKMPWGVAIDNEREYVIISDEGNHRIQVFDIHGGFLFKFGNEGVNEGEFKSPKGVAYSPKGYIIVADSDNHRVQIFNEDGRFMRLFGSQGSDKGQLSCPCGVAYSNAIEMIGVTEQNNHRIQFFSLHGQLLHIFGAQGSGKGQFLYPHHLVFNNKGVCFVSDCVNDRIQVFNKDFEFQTSFGEEGTRDSQFDGPEGVAVDDEGNILVCDNHNHRIQVFDSEGKFVVHLGSYGENVGYFKNPCGVAISDAGDIVVVDTGNNRIQVF